MHEKKNMAQAKEIFPNDTKTGLLPFFFFRFGVIITTKQY